MRPEFPKQIDMFTGESIDHRTPRQKQHAEALQRPRQVELFSPRDIAQFGVSARPRLLISPKTTLELASEDHQTGEEKERDLQCDATRPDRWARSRTYFPAPCRAHLSGLSEPSWRAHARVARKLQLLNLYLLQNGAQPGRQLKQLFGHALVAQNGLAQRRELEVNPVAVEGAFHGHILLDLAVAQSDHAPGGASDLMVVRHHDQRGALSPVQVRE